jgi:hypothetical protein
MGGKTMDPEEIAIKIRDKNLSKRSMGKEFPGVSANVLALAWDLAAGLPAPLHAEEEEELI